MNKPDDLTKLKRFGSELINWAIRLMIVGSFLFIWRMYEAQQIFISHQNVTDMRIAQLEKDTAFRIAQIEKDIARIEGTMMTRSMFKGIEVYIDLILTRMKIPHAPVNLTGDQK